jgi:hypothetical protein
MSSRWSFSVLTSRATVLVVSPRSAPLRAVESSRLMVSTLSRPPPFNSCDNAPKTTSTSGTTCASVADNDAPGDRTPVADSPAGGSSATKRSPRRLVSRRVGTAFAASFTPGLTRQTTFALRSDRRVMASTLPTTTSPVRQVSCGTRFVTSSKTIETR